MGTPSLSVIAFHQSGAVCNAIPSSSRRLHVMCHRLIQLVAGINNIQLRQSTGITAMRPC